MRPAKPWPKPPRRLSIKNKACSTRFAAAASAKLDCSVGVDTSKGLDFEAVERAFRHFALACVGHLVE